MSAIHLSSALVCAKVKGLILENTFTSIPDMVDVVMPWVAPMKSLVLRIGWHSKARIPAITAPILFISGRRDELVPPAHMDALLAAARTSLYTVMHKVPEGKHNDTWQVPFLHVVRERMRWWGVRWAQKIRVHRVFSASAGCVSCVSRARRSWNVTEHALHRMAAQYGNLQRCCEGIPGEDRCAPAWIARDRHVPEGQLRTSGRTARELRA